MGPAGVLRYPSYLEQNMEIPRNWCFQCYDKYMLGGLKVAAENHGKPEWGCTGPTDASEYNNWPEDTNFSRENMVAGTRSMANSFSRGTHKFYWIVEIEYFRLSQSLKTKGSKSRLKLLASTGTIEPGPMHLSSPLATTTHVTEMGTSQ